MDSTPPVDKQQQQQPSSTPFPSPDVAVHLHPTPSSSSTTLTRLWSQLAQPDAPARDGIAHQLAASPASLDAAILHLQAFHSLINPLAPSPLSPPPSSMHPTNSPPAPPPSTPQPSFSPVSASTSDPPSLASLTQPQAGEAPSPSPDSHQWGSTLILPWPRYRSLHPSASPFELFPLWWLSSLFRPLTDRAFNHCRVRTPWAWARRVVSAPVGLDGMKSTSAWNLLWTWLGCFFSLGCIGLLHQYYTVPRYDWPIMFASHGALATLMFSTPGNNAVQPYHCIVGTLVSTFLAVLIEQNMDTTELLWLAIALSAAAAITTQQLLGCNHPPGGALAVLYIAVPSLQVLGYWYILAAEVGVLITMCVSLVVNNVPLIEGRGYPKAWFG